MVMDAKAKVAQEELVPYLVNFIGTLVKIFQNRQFTKQAFFVAMNRKLKLTRDSLDVYLGRLLSLGFVESKPVGTELRQGLIYQATQQALSLVASIDNTPTKKKKHPAIPVLPQKVGFSSSVKFRLFATDLAELVKRRPFLYESMQPIADKMKIKLKTLRNVYLYNLVDQKLATKSLVNGNRRHGAVYQLTPSFFKKLADSAELIIKSKGSFATTRGLKVFARKLVEQVGMRLFEIDALQSVAAEMGISFNCVRRYHFLKLKAYNFVLIVSQDKKKYSYQLTPALFTALEMEMPVS